MIGSGKIAQKGMLSPAKDLPYGPFMDALAARGISVKVRETELEKAATALHDTHKA
jgi:hypothetical protein